MPGEQNAVERGWCSACGKWRRIIRGSQIGNRCGTCNSGRIRPPHKGETIPTMTKPPGDDDDG